MSTYRLPKSIDVLGTEYRVTRITGLSARDGIEGFCSASEYIIALDAKLKGKYLKRIFFHEVGHAFSYECGLFDALNSNEACEMFCQSFSALICQLMK